MNRRNTTFACTLAAMSLAACVCAAPKPKKPAPKPVKKPAPRVVLGTKQLSGDKAVLGTTYTLGKEWPMNVTLNSIEYTTDRLVIGEEAYIPGADEKFLVLRMTMHNPQKAEALVRYDTFDFTAVDSTNTNREGRQVLGAEVTGQDLSINLKPGQKVNAFTFIPVPARGIVPKLIIKASDNLVLRYDLKDKVKPLTGPTVDTAVKDGATALSVVPAQFGKTYQVGVFDVTVTGAVYSDKQLEDQEFEEGDRNFIVSATVKNAHPQEQLLRYDSFEIKYADQDGAEISFSNALLSGTRDANFDANLAPGKEMKVRFPLKVAKDQQVTSMSISQGDNPRAFVFDTTAVK